MARDLKTLHNLQKGAVMVKEGIEKDAYELGAKVKEKVEEGQQYAKNSLHSLEDQTKANPLLALGVAFIAGFVASKFFDK